jgi:peptide chain release factor 1
MDKSNSYLEQELEEIEQKITEATGFLGDESMADMAKKEIEELEKQKEALQIALKTPNTLKTQADGIVADDFKHILLEARGGVGGDEAKIWAEDLMRMYTRYANKVGWKVEAWDEGVLRISGKGVFNTIKYETGVHRVQRVPETEAAGRIHTSTASIVVLPEVPETAIEIREDELLWEFTRGGGHGGQNVNKVATAVRLTHKPTGMVVQAREERFQEQNRKIALALLRSQLWEIEQEKKAKLISDQRSVVGRSMRSEKVRTYNYPQNRVTDHRIGKSWHKLEMIMEGDLDDVFEDLAAELGNKNPGGDNNTANDKSGGDGLSQPEVG